MGISHPNEASKPQSPAGRTRPRVIPFGKYLLLERLAVGGMAEVYLAKSFGSDGTERLLAIKRILPTMAEDLEFIEMFIDEAKIAGHLSHANIVPIYELGKIGDSHYIAMEYVWGKDLLQIMNRFRRMRRRTPPAMVAWIASKLCEGLDYAHKKQDRNGRPLNLIHRDVSPQNILVSYDGDIKIIDFGIAKAASRTTRTQAGVLKGKFGYMSPEQVRGILVDHRSDLFAVGTCMYEMVTGERLFLGESDFSTLERVRNADIQPASTVVPNLPTELNSIIMKALARDAEDRWQSGADLNVALKTFLEMQKQQFDTNALSSWLKSSFAAELAQEKERLENYKHIGRPSVLGSGQKQALDKRAASSSNAITPPRARQPFPELPAFPGAETLRPPPAAGAAAKRNTNFDDEEPTEVSRSPFDMDPPSSSESRPASMSLADEPTQVFFSSEDLEEAAEKIAPSVPRPSTSVPPPPPPPRNRGESSRAESGKSRSSTRTSEDPRRPSTKPRGQNPFSQRQIATAHINRRSIDRYIKAHRRKSSRKQWALGTFAALVLLFLGAAMMWVFLGINDAGALEIHTLPSVGATVQIDGIARGRAPVRVEEVPSGKRRLEIFAEGYVPATRDVRIEPGSTTMLEIALVPLPIPRPDTRFTPPPLTPIVPRVTAPPTEVQKNGMEKLVPMPASPSTPTTPPSASSATSATRSTN